MGVDVAVMKLGAVILPATTALGGPGTSPTDSRVAGGSHTSSPTPRRPRSSPTFPATTAGSRLVMHRLCGEATATPNPSPAQSRSTRRPRRTTRCSSTSRRARRAIPSSSSTLTAHIPSVTCRRCTSSGCGRGTFTSISAHRDGRSMPGVRFFSPPPGSPSPRSWPTTTPDSTRRGFWRCCSMWP